MRMPVILPRVRGFACCGALLFSMLVPASGAGSAAAEAKPLWVVVTTPTLSESLKPLVDKRGKDGFETQVLTQPIDKAVKAFARRPSYLLIVGDWAQGKERMPWFVASKRVQAYQWRSDQPKEYLSDVLWGDLNGDGAPEIPVGRIPARTAEDVKLCVDKILAWERHEPTVDDLRMPVWTGAPCFGPEIDSLAVTQSIEVMQNGVPKWAQPTLIAGDVTSPFCGWPAEQAATYTAELKKGGLIALMMGHGSREGFFSMAFRNTPFGYDGRAAAQLDKGNPAPPLVIFACYTGDFGGSGACIAESLCGMAGGPVAVIAATTESHPLTNYFAGTCILQQLSGKARRLGDLWLATQRASMKVDDPAVEQLLLGVESKGDQQIDKEKLRRDHMLMYEIIGDPATAIMIPQPMEATIKRDGAKWRWTATKPAGATKLFVGLRQAREIPEAPQELEAAQAKKTFAAANSALAFTALASPEAGKPWQGTIDKPGTVRLVATGPGVLKVAVLDAEPEPGKGN